MKMAKVKSQRPSRRTAETSQITPAVRAACLNDLADALESQNYPNPSDIIAEHVVYAGSNSRRHRFQVDGRVSGSGSDT